MHMGGTYLFHSLPSHVWLDGWATVGGQGVFPMAPLLFWHTKSQTIHPLEEH